MHHNAAIHAELKDLNSQLAAWAVVNVFKVPLGYFDTLEAEIFSNVLAANAARPDNSFESSIDDLLPNADIFEQSPDEIPTILPGNTNIFEVPQGYFQALPEQVLSSVRVSNTKLITIKPRFEVVKYAIAAAVTGLLGLSLFNVFNNNDTAATLHSQPSVVFADAARIIKSNSFDAEMNKLEEREILTFLEADGEDVSAALVASVADDQTLPEESQYFIDDQILDQFLLLNNIPKSSN